jgi:tetratricopeptide (TPR) repeat protein
MIGPWEIESLYRVTNAFLAIDRVHPEVAEIRERHATLAEQGPRALLHHPPRLVPPEDMPGEAAAALRRFEAAYEPPVPEGVASARGLVAAAEWRLAQNDMERAQRDARRAIVLDALDGRAHATLAEILSVDGRWEEARSVLTEAVVQGLHDWEVHEALGRIASELGEQVEACAQLHLALARRPESPATVKARLGNGYRKIGHINLARTYLDAACAEEPDNFLGGLFKLQLLRQLVTDAEEAGDRERLTVAVEEAEDFFRALEACRALHPEYLFVQSQIMAAIGRLDLAEAALRRALELDPALDHVRKFLAAIVEWRAERDNSLA